LQDPGNGTPPPHGGTGVSTQDSGAPAPDGGFVTVLASGVASPTAIALGASSVYWTDGSGGVWAVPRGGGSKTSVATAQVAPVAIAVNPALGTPYWANAGNGAKGGGSIVTLDPSTSIVTTLTTGLVGPYGIAADSQFVYWTDESTTQPGVDVAQVPLGGGPALEVGSVTGDLSAGGLAIDGASAYFASSLLGGGGSVGAVPLAGGVPDTLWETTAGRPTTVVLGASALYWLVSSPPPQGAVWGVSLPGGKPAALASNLSSPGQLAVDANDAYWTSPATGEVLSVPLAGGTPVAVATGLSSPSAIAVDDAIYVTTANSVVRIAK
jgi:hypothetical protein